MDDAPERKLNQKIHVRRRKFLKRFARNLSIGIGMTLSFLLIGMWGYMHYEHSPWVDAYANAAMIMSGVGPISNPQTIGGKLFAGTYSLFSGMGFLIIIGIIFVPIFRWVFHQAHLEEEE